MTRTIGDLLTVTNLLTASGGVKFAAGSGTLNRYETGTWTPRVTFNNVDTSSYSTQDGRYIIIGDMLIFNLAIILTGKGAGSAQARIDQFPYAQVGTAPYLDVQFFGMATNWLRIGMSLAGTVGTLRGQQAAGTGLNAVAVNASDFSATTTMIMYGNYKI